MQHKVAAYQLTQRAMSGIPGPETAAMKTSLSMRNFSILSDNFPASMADSGPKNSACK